MDGSELQGGRSRRYLEQRDMIALETTHAASGVGGQSLLLVVVFSVDC